jgi:hypothetical protein
MRKKKLNYVKTGFVFAIAFVLVYILIEFLFRLNSKESLQEITKDMMSLKFIGKKLILAIIYGAFMTFFMKRKSEKMKRR